MLTRWRSLDDLTRFALVAALFLAVIATIAIATWWHTGPVQYLVQNVLPPSLWTLLGIGIAHCRQMTAHRATWTVTARWHETAKAAHAEARTARKISADLYKHQTGLHHPEAPREGA